MASDKKKVSIKEVAALSGVSIATVSRVINNNGRFSEETKKKVFDVIEKYGYTTNMAAKSLRQARSQTIGMIVPDISNEFFARISLDVEKYFYDKGYSVFICNSAKSSEKEKQYFRSLDAKLVDGIVCISGQRNLPRELFTRNTPVVCIDRFPDHENNIGIVSSDGVSGGYLATNHLLKAGCRDILHVVSAIGEYARHLRTEGYEKALYEYKIPLDPDKIIHLSGKQPSVQESEALVDQCIENGMKFDGIFAVSDRAAYGALTSLKKHGIKVPEEVKIVGFDDSVYSQLSSPSITTIRQDTTLLAHTACEILYRFITTEEEVKETDVVLPVELVVRETTMVK